MALLTKIGRMGWVAGTSALAAPLALVLFASAAQGEVVVTANPGLPGPQLADPDQAFILEFDGNVNGTGVDGLSAMVELTFLQAYDVTDGASGYNVWIFNAAVTNTSDTVIDPLDPTDPFVASSRVSAFGFDTGGFCDDINGSYSGDSHDDEGHDGDGHDGDGDGHDGDGDNDSGGEGEYLCRSDHLWEDTLLGVGSAGGEFDTRVVTDDPGDPIFGYSPALNTLAGEGDTFADTPVFKYDNDGKFPNQFGPLDVCFIMNSNNCSGGGSGGVSTSDPTLGFTFVLAFAGSLVDNPQIELSNFGVRYQSIAVCASSSSHDDHHGDDYDDDYDEGDDSMCREYSGTGRHRAPEPGSLAIMALGLVGIGWSRKRRKRVA